MILKSGARGQRKKRGKGEKKCVSSLCVEFARRATSDTVLRSANKC